MGLIKGLLWWGYIDDRGKITVKRYIDDKTIANYERMSDVKGIFDPFEAFDRKHAEELVFKRYQIEMSFN